MLVILLHIVVRWFRNIEERLNLMKKSIINVNLLASSICNLNCKYCYVPKVPELKSAHKELNENIKNGSIIDLLKENFDLTNLSSVAFWGAEPTLNLDNCFTFVNDLCKDYNITSLTIPTNLTPDVDETIFPFVQKLQDLNKEIKINLQVSLDGPNFITDKNRGIGTTKKILQNLDRIIKYYNETDLKKISFRIFGKQTWSVDNLIFLKNNMEIIKYIGLFFTNLQDELIKKNKNKNIEFGKFSLGNFATPGNYTVDDGTNLNDIYKYCIKNNYLKSIPFIFYVNHLRKIFELNHVFTKPFSVSCGSKDSASIGVDNKIHMCHRSFHTEYENDWFCNKFVYSEKDINKMEYVVQSYHRFSFHTTNLTANIIIELAKNSQVLKKYKDPNHAFILATFVNLCICCPLENLIVNSNINCNPVSSIRLFGNGAMEQVIKYYYEKEKIWRT